MVDLYTHIFTVHGQEFDEYKCEKCEMSYKKLHFLQKHVKEYHQKGEYRCDHCDKIFNEQHYLKNHVIAQHEQWQEYQKRQNEQEQANISLKIPNEEITINSCNDCESSFENICDLYLHINENHNTAFNDYKCNKCDKVCEKIGNLKHHIRVVHKKGIFKCENCNEVFYEWLKYRLHRDTIHEDAKNIPCNQPGCDKLFKSLGLMNSHVKQIHFAENKYLCDRCDKGFKQKGSLLEHIRVIHDKLKIFQCHKCEKSFGQKSGLRYHLQAVHDGIRKHKCPVCDKDFTSLAQAKAHVKFVHEGGIKEFQCDDCKKMFMTESSLRKHIRIVHQGLKNFVCTTCGKAFQGMY